MLRRVEAIEKENMDGAGLILENQAYKRRETSDFHAFRPEFGSWPVPSSAIFSAGLSQHLNGSDHKEGTFKQRNMLSMAVSLISRSNRLCG